jgi:hypothetical protein
LRFFFWRQVSTSQQFWTCGQVCISEINPHVVGLVHFFFVILLSVLADNLAKKHTSLVAHRGGRAGTQKAINSQKCKSWMCVQFPPKNKEKIRKSARTHLAFRASWDTLLSLPHECRAPGFFSIFFTAHSAVLKSKSINTNRPLAAPDRPLWTKSKGVQYIP